MLISKRLLNNEWYKSINGVWSPLNSWLAAPLIYFFKNDVLAFKLINLFASVGIIIVVHDLLKRFVVITTSKQHILLVGISFSLPIILLSHTHYQLSGDLLQLFIVLLYVRLLFEEDFFVSITKNLLAGGLIALASYAKAYNLPFLGVTHLVIYLVGFFLAEINSKRSFLAFFKPLLVTYCSVFALVLPWIILIHDKYKIWAFSTVQKFNFHWLLNSESYTTLKTDDLLVSPTYADSPTAWEDPFSIYNSFTGPMDSVTTFLHFLKNISHNIKVYFIALNELSFFAVAILAYCFYQVFIKKERSFQFLVASFVSLFVAVGYLMIYIEVRYIWLAGILLLILGAKLIDEIFFVVKSKVLYISICCIFLVSFLLTPLDKLQDMRFVGTDLQKVKAFFETNNIMGNFTVISSLSAQESWSDELAFTTSSRFYRISRPIYTEEELFMSIEKNKINYVLYFYATRIEKEKIMENFLQGKTKQIYSLDYKNCLVFVMNKKT